MKLKALLTAINISIQQSSKNTQNLSLYLHWRVLVFSITVNQKLFYMLYPLKYLGTAGVRYGF
jgi:hypothetical protein